SEQALRPSPKSRPRPSWFRAEAVPDEPSADRPGGRRALECPSELGVRRGTCRPDSPRSHGPVLQILSWLDREVGSRPRTRPAAEDNPLAPYGTQPTETTTKPQ